MKYTISNKIARLAGTALAALVLMGSALSADAGAYMKFDGVDGECQDEHHKDWITIESLSHAIVRGGGLTGQSRRRGDVVLGDVVCVKELDKASPKIAESVCTGRVFPKVEIEFTRSTTSPDGTDGPVTYLKYELTNVMVTSYSFHGNAAGDPLPTEEITLNFEEIKVTYTEQDKSTGQPKGNVEYSWKVEEGTK
jgi:type VI secretion system secreted protein Hcp